MLETILKNEKFVTLMGEHCFEVLKRLQEEKVEFSVVANMQFVKFDPELPEELSLKNNPFVMFALAGYTFESMELNKERLYFHAGFGADDFATYVSVDLGAITQIQIENTIIFVNFSIYKGKKDEENVKNSKNIFLKNNKDLFK
ncbi:hypothetical protein [Campylobacter helveticus]|uniref:Uncharacterized protein n=1 Tax=Campylobacter helveticus TaxID=28898 RepID=A0AAX2UKC9_9BACT|nr:hypothetical protein [Campylobacter helveticus]ARE80737.1 hypothetical protein CHELV3228_1150 [Campylobacter helveticus]MCR2055235.1 hypothetical protein [Campylobacter helveticus]TNB58662.1 hypothetical protein FDW42_01640 [Campylobacter helveticus]TNB59299.1 hypothetical protein FDW44_03240 [Campylobacter helveticus]TNH35018.1 hypothetical protein FDW48_01850 [Campylobacter helveticus]